ncbi:MAG: pentapeptide repeat-containing protein [Candidatus Aminicenantes bacterium]|nr:pentapeptide repeat-containing protein [Candidatus Aminicenantes bacterium]
MKGKIKIFLFLAVILSIIILAFPFSGNNDTISNKSLKSLDKNIHGNEKLYQTTTKPVVDKKKDTQKTWGILSTIAPFLTALAALAGLFVTIWKHINQQNYEIKNKLNEKFTSNINSLCSDDQLIRASASVSILNFLKKGYEEFHEQVFMILLANLKNISVRNDDDSVRKLIVNSFEKAIRLKLEKSKNKKKESGLDLSRTNLTNADLSKLDLSGVDLAFSKLENTNFTGSNLWRARGIKANMKNAKLSKAILNEARFKKANFYKTHFREANLVAADLRKTNLINAQFQKAKMQSVRLQDADLARAKFEGADITDAHFKGAYLDEQTIKSIFRTKNKSWKRAHFDDEDRIDLEELEKLERIETD